MCIYSSCLLSKIFDDKISLLCSKLPPPPLLSSFAPSTEEEEVRKVIMSSSDFSCDLDIIPTNLLKSCLDVLKKHRLTVFFSAGMRRRGVPIPFHLEKKHWFQRSLNVSFMFVYHHVWSNFHQSLSSNLHTGSFIPLKLPQFSISTTSLPP